MLVSIPIHVLLVCLSHITDTNHLTSQLVILHLALICRLLVRLPVLLWKIHKWAGNLRVVGSRISSAAYCCCALEQGTYCNCFRGAGLQLTLYCYQPFGCVIWGGLGIEKYTLAFLMLDGQQSSKSMVFCVCEGRADTWVHSPWIPISDLVFLIDPILTLCWVLLFPQDGRSDVFYYIVWGMNINVSVWDRITCYSNVSNSIIISPTYFTYFISRSELFH